MNSFHFFFYSGTAITPLTYRVSPSGKLQQNSNASPESVSSSTSASQKTTLLLGQHYLLALHAGELGAVRSEPWRRRRNRRLPAGLTETCTSIEHGTLNWIDWRLIKLSRLVRRRSGSNLILIHRLMMYRLGRDGRYSTRCGRVRWRRRSELGLRGWIHTPTGVTVEWLWHDTGRIWLVRWGHAGHHRVVRRRKLCLCWHLSIHILLICGLLSSSIIGISISSFVVHDKFYVCFVCIFVAPPPKALANCAPNFVCASVYVNLIIYH